MENYSVWADLLETFRMMSDSVKVLLIYMPCIFMLGFIALYLKHIRMIRKEQQPYAIISPEEPSRPERFHPSVETLRVVDEFAIAKRRYDDEGIR